MWCGHLTNFLNFGTPSLTSKFMKLYILQMWYRLEVARVIWPAELKQLLSILFWISAVNVLRITLIFVFTIPCPDGVFDGAATLSYIKWRGCSPSCPLLPRPSGYTFIYSRFSNLMVCLENLGRLFLCLLVLLLKVIAIVWTIIVESKHKNKHKKTIGYIQWKKHNYEVW